MNPRSQTTIAREVSVSGIGIHTGETVKAVLKPAKAGTGIRFIRIDLKRKEVNVGVGKTVANGKSPRRTMVCEDGAEVQTVEHLLAALGGLGIDNLLIELDGSELPGLDGSALPYVNLLNQAGRVELDIPRNIYEIKEPIFCEENGGVIAVFPSDQLKISYTLDYHHPHLTNQVVSFVINAETFEREIAPARTFCTEEEAGKLKSLGLGKGASYDNTLVISKQGVVGNRLRFDNECARHKVLDLVGDLGLLPYSVQGHVVAIRSGHYLNQKMVEAIHMQKQKTGSVKRVQVPSGDFQCPLDIEAIQKILPHRYPFLLVDRIMEIDKDGKTAVGIKNISINEPFFQGHFPGRPIMPGVLIVEAMAQVAAVVLLAKSKNQGRFAYFIGIDNVRFRKPVLPGDQLRIELEFLKVKSKVGVVKGFAKVEGKVVCEAEMMFTLVD